MKIGFLIESMAVASGGPSRVAGAIASGLAERGHDVTIGTLPRSSELVKIDQRVRLEHVSGMVRNPLNWFRAARGIQRLAAKADVLFVSGIWGPVDGLARRLAGIRSIPVHTRICGMLEDYILNRHPERKWLARHLYTDSNLSRSASLIVNTPIEAEHVKALGFTTPIQVIPNGVPLPPPGEQMDRSAALATLGLPSTTDGRFVLYLSRIHPKKGLHLLLEGLEGVLASHPDWRLLVAGSFFEGENYEGRIRGMIANSRFHERIHLVGEVAGERKRAALSLGSLFVLPSESEGFSNAIIEALSWSIPAIITTGCNFPEVAENGAGWVVSPQDDSLTTALGEALQQPGKLESAAGNARALIERGYQQSHVIDLYEALARRGLP
jgi:glycosyltransferase involved in cell wall biosynthesis